MKNRNIILTGLTDVFIYVKNQNFSIYNSFSNSQPDCKILGVQKL